jgi:hypothetical protein
VDPSKLNLDALNSSRTTSNAIQRPSASSSSRNEEPRVPEDQLDDSNDDDDVGSCDPAGKKGLMPFPWAVQFYLCP